MSIQERMHIRTFTDLHVWKIAHQFVLDVYRASGSFPSNEQFGLTSQLRRSVVSVTSNIAEGFGRRSAKDKVQFYFISLGSLFEAQNQLIIANDVGYLSMEDRQRLFQKVEDIRRLLHGFITAVEKATYQRKEK